METVLLAAGEGDGLDPLTASLPKPLVPVGGEPLVARTARTAVAAGATSLVVVVPPYVRPFVRALGESVAGVPVTYAVQPRPTGTANALVAAKPHLDGEFVVVPGDTLFETRELAALYETVPSVGLAEGAPPGGDRALVGDGGVVSAETRARDDAGAVGDVAACSLPAAALGWTRVPRNDDGERDLSGVVERAATERDVRSVRIGDRVDVDAPGDLLAANRRAMDDWAADVEGPVVEGRVSDRARLHGPVSVESDASVAAGAVVEGPAIVAAGATVGPNAHLDAYTYVGEDVELGHSVHLENAIVLADAVVSHSAHLPDSVVGSDAHVGVGATVGNRRPDGDRVLGADDTAYRRPNGGEFGVVVGASATVGANASIDVGVTLDRYQRTEPDATMLADD